MPTAQQRQRVLVLYLSSSALDSSVIAWANYDGTGATQPMAGDQSEPPYRTGVHALLDGWRLIQASPLIQHGEGEECRTGYLKYEFFFERLVDVTSDPARGAAG
jgi:hypothetical protein